MFTAGATKRSGHSRTDMVVLMVVGGTVISLLVIALARVRRHQERIPYHDGNHLKDIALASHMFNDEFKRLPPAFDQFEPRKFAFPASVHVHLLPFLENDPVYEVYRNNPDQFKLSGAPIINVYVTSADPSPRRGTAEDYMGVQNFAANLRVFSDKGRNTTFDADMPALARVEAGMASIPGSFEDGLSNTILLTTKFARCGKGGSQYLAAPDTAFAAFFGQNAARRPAHPSEQGVTFQLGGSPEDCRPIPLTAQSNMERSIPVALADGSVRIVARDISPQTWNKLLQPNDGMGVGRDWND